MVGNYKRLGLEIVGVVGNCGKLCVRCAPPGTPICFVFIVAVFLTLFYSWITRLDDHDYITYHIIFSRNPAHQFSLLLVYYIELHASCFNSSGKNFAFYIVT